jgi:hypothetical protein
MEKNLKILKKKILKILDIRKNFFIWELAMTPYIELIVYLCDITIYHSRL